MLSTRDKFSAIISEIVERKNDMVEVPPGFENVAPKIEDKLMADNMMSAY
jgi:hypothetical protein